MKWLVISAITILGMAGCRGSQTSCNTLAPFGASRISPPSTSHFGAAGGYYNRGAPVQTASPVAPGAAPAASPAGTIGAQALPPNASADAGGSWAPSAKAPGVDGALKPSLASLGSSAVQQASYQTAPAANPVSTSSLSGSSLRLAGMPVNDATTGGSGQEPARFVPVGTPIEIAQLPPATTTAAADAPVSASVPGSNAVNATAASSQTTLNWKSRP